MKPAPTGDHWVTAGCRSSRHPQSPLSLRRVQDGLNLHPSRGKGKDWIPAVDEMTVIQGSAFSGTREAYLEERRPDGRFFVAEPPQKKERGALVLLE